MATPPPYQVRSYGGGAEPAQLVEEMGTTDTSFGITNTTGWTEADGNPLGTSGNFVVIIDRFTDTIEKIECSAVNLATGLVTVYTITGYSGRGYDGTTPQAHVPGGSTSGVQTTWSSVEAAEANKVVATIFGPSAGTQETGDFLSWESGAPLWQPASAATGLSLAGVGEPIIGSPPAANSGGFLLQGGTAVTTTNGTGGFAVNFPYTFPNGLLTLIIVNGDNESGGVGFQAINTGAYARTGFDASSWAPDGTANADTPIRCNWFAIGF